MKVIAKGTNDISVFDSAYMEVFKLMLDPFKKFLSNFDRRSELIKLKQQIIIFLCFYVCFLYIIYCIHEKNDKKFKKK